MFKVGFFGVSAALLALVLRREKSEYAIVLVLSAGVLIFAYAIAQVAVVMEFLDGIIEQLPFDVSYLQILFKMLGISYVGEFASNICKDAGYSSIAGQIEVFAKLTIVALSLPCLSYLIGIVGEFL